MNYWLNARATGNGCVRSFTEGVNEVTETAVICLTFQLGISQGATELPNFRGQSGRASGSMREPESIK
jgi:hypothetical protein